MFTTEYNITYKLLILALFLLALVSGDRNHVIIKQIENLHKN